MNVFIVLILSLSTHYSTYARPEPYNTYHRNYSVYTTTYHTYSYQNNFTVPITFPGNVKDIPNFQLPPPPHNQPIQVERLNQPVPDPPSDHNAQIRNKRNITGKSCMFDFCDYADVYPNTTIDEIFNRTREFDKFIYVPEIFDRTFGVDEENICSSVTNVSFPQTGKNQDGKMRIIANDKNYKQGVVMETCRPNAVCEFSQSFPLGVTTVCKQRYTQLRLLALDEDDKPTIDVFKAPSCCVCMYKRT